MSEIYPDQKFVVFVDIRGFTKWSGSIDVFNHVEDFISPFRKSVGTTFSFAEKPREIGDGMMIYGHYDDTSLANILEAINECEKQFSVLVEKFSRQVGRNANLALGWGIARGLVRELGEDILGHTVNRASRLCGIARPFGIVIDAENFYEIPALKLGYVFVKKTRILDGIDEAVNVWVTEEIAQQFIGREHLRERPEVHVSGVCVKKNFDDFEIFIAKRNEDRKLFGGRFEGCGGQLASNESFVDGVKRHYKREMGLDVNPCEDIHNFYLITEPNEPLIQGVRFLCVYISGVPSSTRHSEFRWVTIEQLAAIPDSDLVPGFKTETISLINKFKNSR